MTVGLHPKFLKYLNYIKKGDLIIVSIMAHVAIGILFTEVILHVRIKNPSERSDKRIKYWIIGFLFGILPDLDVIPALILGFHPYTFHHIYTHTFLAIGILALITIIIRKKEFALPMFAAYGSHILADFIDNSISPLGPFFPTIEWGLIPGWGEIPLGGWTSDYWLLPEYNNHDLWTIFMSRGWGVQLPVMNEFLSYYDLVLTGIFIGLFVYLTYLLVLRIKNRK